jgi:formate--tetrahydrofolate ligase
VRGLDQQVHLRHRGEIELVNEEDGAQVPVLSPPLGDGAQGRGEGEDVVGPDREGTSFKFVTRTRRLGQDQGDRDQIYGASTSRRTQVRARSEAPGDGYGHYRCASRRPSTSFSNDARLRGAPSGHVVNVREVRLAAGAEFVVMVCGDIMTMPGCRRCPPRRRST